MRDQLIAEAATYRAKQMRQTSMPSVGFEPAIPAIRQLQTYSLDHTATRISKKYYWAYVILCLCVCGVNLDSEGKSSRTLKCHIVYTSS